MNGLFIRTAAYRSGPVLPQAMALNTRDAEFMQ
jgi:hypothetical protein